MKKIISIILRLIFCFLTIGYVFAFIKTKDYLCVINAVIFLYLSIFYSIPEKKKQEEITFDFEKETPLKK